MAIIDTNTFFITAPFATDGLRAKVSADKAKLEKMEATYAGLRDQFVSLSGDLTIMEEKSGFLERQIVRSMTIFDPPPDGATAAEYEKKQVVYDALLWTGTAVGAVGGVLSIVGQVGLSRTVKASLATRKVGAASKIKAGAKLGTLKIGAGRSVIASARTARVAQATKAAKLGKFGKIAKVGKVSGVLTVAIVALELGLKMASAAKMNKYFIEQADKIREVIDDADKAIKALEQGIKEGSAMKQSMLDDAGCADVMAYLEKLNHAIADVGRANAKRSLVRRMLLDGMATSLVEQYSELSSDQVAGIHAKLKVELGLLRGDDVATLVNDSALNALQVGVIKRMFDARIALLGGAPAAEVMASCGLSDVTVSGVATSLARDIRQVWALFGKDKTADAIAHATLLPQEAVEHLQRELVAKRLLLEDMADAAVADKSGAAVEQIAQWRAALGDDLTAARERVAKAQKHERPSDIAADYRLPTEALAA